jgi:D-alanyl-D-alanine dipeptidase
MPSLTAPSASLDLVEITNPAILIELAYAGPHNFTGQTLYRENRAFLRPEAARAIDIAASAVAAQGLRLVLLDAFRPVSVQKILWDFRPDPEFVADPKVGSDHSRGTAVDVTLADASGHLDMGTGFDVAAPQSHHDRDDIGETARRNREILRDAMAISGFEENPHEWWHYALRGFRTSPLIDGWPTDGAGGPGAPG